MIRLFLRLVKIQRISIIINIGIFLFMCFLYGIASPSADGFNSISSAKISIAWKDQDQSDLSKALFDYVNEKTDVYLLNESEEMIKDALFYGQIVAVVHVPKGFEEQFMTQGSVLNINQQPNSTQGIMLQQQLNSFLRQMHILRLQEPTQSYQEVAQKSREIMSLQSEVALMKTNEQSDQDSYRNNLYKFFSYIMIQTLLNTIGLAIMLVYRPDIMKRNLASPLKSTNFNMSVCAAVLLFGTIMWFVLISTILVVQKGELLTLSNVLYMLNSYVYACVGMALAFLVSVCLFNKRNGTIILTAFSTTFSLGSAFLCGAFVPQALMGEQILQVAHFLPGYWYVKACDTLQLMTDTALQESLIYIGIQVLFVITLFVLGLYIMKQKRRMNAFISDQEAE